MLKVESKPSLISCQTLIGYGSPNKQNTAGSHGAPLGEEEIEMAKKFEMEFDKFELPEQVLKMIGKEAGKEVLNYLKNGKNKIPTLRQN